MTGISFDAAFQARSLVCLFRYEMPRFGEGFAIIDSLCIDSIVL